MFRYTSAILCSLAFTTSAQANLLTNGSFESPSIPDGTAPVIASSSWNGGGFLMNPNASGKTTGNPFTWPQAQSGQQYDNIGDIASLFLSQTFTIASSATYNFTWYDNTALNIVPGFRTAPYSISLINSSLQPVFSYNFDSYHATGTWQSRTLSQALTPDSYTLEFTSLNFFNGTDTLIDNVAVNAVNPSQVPEPATIALISLGLAGMGWKSRRKATA